MNEYVRFLILRLTGKEEIELSLKLINAIKSKFNEVEIEFITLPENVDFAKQVTQLEYVHSFGRVSATVREMKYLHFDYILDLEDSSLSNKLVNRVGVYSFKAPSYRFKKMIKRYFGIGTIPETPLIERYFDTLRVFEISLND